MSRFDYNKWKLEANLAMLDCRAEPMADDKRDSRHHNTAQQMAGSPTRQQTTSSHAKMITTPTEQLTARNDKRDKKATNNDTHCRIVALPIITPKNTR